MGGFKDPQQQQTALPAVDDQFFEYLNALLQQAEESGGGPDLELRAKIESLRTETRRVPAASSSEMSEVEVASKLDEVEQKLKTVTKILDEVDKDPEAKSFLSSSSKMWMAVITATAEERRAISSPPTPPATGDAHNSDADK